MTYDDKKILDHDRMIIGINKLVVARSVRVTLENISLSPHIIVSNI